MSDDYHYPGYWDCDCDENYIHPDSQKSCDICGMTQEEGPEAIRTEVEEAKAKGLLK